MRLNAIVGLSISALAGCYSSSSYSNADLSGTIVWADAVNVALDGNGSGILTVQVAQSDGRPVAGVGAQFAQTGCVTALLQPSTDANGMIEARITCSGTGQRLLQPTVVLDDFTLSVNSSVTLNFFTPTGNTLAAPAGTKLNYQLVMPRLYRGTLHFLSSDPNAQLPADYTFQPSDRGVKEFINGLQFATPGQQTVAAVDTVTQQHVSIQTFAVASPGVVSLVLRNAAADAVANAPLSFDVAALDANGVLVPSYAATVSFYSSDGRAQLPAPYTFSAADGGTHHFSATLLTAGPQSIAISDGVFTQAAPIDVAPGAPSQLTVHAPAAASAGDSLSVTVVVSDSAGNVVPSFVDTLHFTSTDPNALLPADFAMTAANAGSATFPNVSFVHSGPQTLDVTALNQSLTGDANVLVSAKNAVALVLNANSTTPAGAPFSLQVSAVDAYGNLVTSYTGTVRFNGTDASAIYPGAYTFSSLDAGTHVFVNGVSLVTAGNQTLLANDETTPAISGVAAVQVTALTPFTLTINALPATAQAGTPVSFGVASVDRYGNINPAYTGTMHFTCTDTTATVPGDTPFAANANGIMTFTNGLRMTVAARQSLVVSDTGHSLVSGGAPITVLPGPATQLSLSGLGAQIYQSHTQSSQVTALDTYGNVATSYNGVVHFASSDPNASLPADGTPTNGQEYYPLTFASVGNQNVTVSDANANLSASAAFLVVHQCVPYGASQQVTASWTTVPMLAVNSNDLPAVTYQDYTSGSAQTYVKAFDGTSWNALDESASGGGLSQFSGTSCPTGQSSPVGIFYNANNTLSVGYGGSCGATNGLLLASYDGSAWVGNANSNVFPGVWASPNQPIATFFAQNHSGQVAALVQNANGTMQVVELQGNAWSATPSGIVPAIATANGVSFVMDANGHVFVAYSASALSEYDIYVAAFDGNTWRGLAGSNSGGGVSNNGGASISPSIALDPNGNPVVAWLDDTGGTDNVYVAAFNGTSWNAVGDSLGATGMTNAHNALLVTLQVDSTGKPWVAWADDINGSGDPEIYYRQWSGTAWVGNQGSDTGQGVSQIGPNGNIFDIVFVLNHHDVPLFGWATWYGHAGQVCHW